MMTLKLSSLFDYAMQWARRCKSAWAPPFLSADRSLRRWSKEVSWGRYVPYTQRGIPLTHAMSSTVLSLDRHRVLRAARWLEPDLRRRVEWFLYEPIYELGGMTAEELIKCGETKKVLNMLYAIGQGERDI